MKKQALLFLITSFLAVILSFAAIPPATVGAQSYVVHFDFGGAFKGKTGYMYAWGDLDTSTGYLSFQQRARNPVKLTGFKGCSQLFFVNANGLWIGRSPVYRLGVDGQWVGPSDRTVAHLSTDANGYWVPLGIANQTTSIVVAHWHCPNNIVQAATQLAGHLMDTAQAIQIVTDAVIQAAADTRVVAGIIFG